MRRAEHNTIERKNDVIKSKFSGSKPGTSLHQSIQSRRQSATAANSSSNNNYQSEDTTPLGYDAIESSRVKQAIDEESNYFNQQLIKVYDELAPPIFNEAKNKRHMAALQAKMSESCDRIDEKDNKAHIILSSDKTLDKNVLGPVYCKIVAQRKQRASDLRRKARM